MFAIYQAYNLSFYQNRYKDGGFHFYKWQNTLTLYDPRSYSAKGDLGRLLEDKELFVRAFVI